ncbi:MAG: hypothetical protein R2939_02390 [Kofleriaceae bacterium]
MKLVSVASSTLLSLLAACAATPTGGYDDTWGSEIISSGKADGLLDDATVLALGASVRGNLGEDDLDIYRMDLAFGDRILLSQRVIAGDLAPHFTLYVGTTTSVRSATFAVRDDGLDKTYEITQSGRYFVGVRAYQGVGTGDYTLSAACTGGPCAGEPIVVPLTAETRGECLEAARECSFAALPAYDGAVGPARARTIFQGCLGRVTASGGEACGEACRDDDDAQAVCEDLISALPFYADQDATCLGELEDCMDSCVDAGGGGTPEEMWSTEIAICWSNGFNGTCDGYARGHSRCGGDEYVTGSTEACYALCHATTGAWLDDLDDLCDQACED